MSKCKCGNECNCGITTVRCCLTDCKFNSACCINPKEDYTYCTLKNIDLALDEETGIIDCIQYERTEKPYECMDCQIDKYGEVEFENDNIEFIEVENIEDLFK